VDSGIAEVSRKVETHPGGFRFAIIEYTCAAQETALTEWEIVVDADNEKLLFILASSATASWARYQPMFQRFIDSMRKNGAHKP